MDLKELLGSEESKQKLFEGLKENGFEVFDEAKKQEFGNNFSSERIKQREFELKVGYEKDIEKLTGDKKAVSEKTHEYLNRVLGSSVAKVKELEERLKNSNSNDDVIKQIQESFSKKEQEYLSKISEYDTQFTNYKKENAFNDSLKSLNISKEIDKEYLDLKLNEVKQRYLQKLSFDEAGKVVLLNEKGDVLRNESNNMNPFTLEELLSKELEKFIDKGRNVPGANTQPPANNNPETKDVPRDLETYVKSKVPKSESDVLLFVQEYYISKNENPRSREATKSFAILSKMLGY